MFQERMETAQMDTKLVEIKDRLKEKPAIIAISGPSGAGKDYLTQKALEHFKTAGITSHNVQMTTEREHRGAVETKICITPEAYTDLQKQGQFLGDHVNKVRYGYNVEDLESAISAAKTDGGLVILELNPAKQNDFPQELAAKLGVNLTSWVGVETTLEQTRVNMEERGESEETIKARLEIMQEFIDAMENNPAISLVNNGPKNRERSSSDFIRIIEDSILAS